jgi:hypothetical protein
MGPRFRVDDEVGGRQSRGNCSFPCTNIRIIPCTNIRIAGPSVEHYAPIGLACLVSDDAAPALANSRYENVNTLLGSS